MIDVKFKAISKITNEWVYGYYTSQWDRDNAGGSFLRHYIEDISGNKHPIKRESLGQFINVFDKKGDEIFSGDKVIFQDYEHHVEDFTENEGFVSYDNFGFSISNRISIDMEDFYIDEDRRCDELLVIGNKHTP